MQADGLLYDAERAIHYRQFPARVDGVQEYYDYVTGTTWFRNRWPKVIKRNVEVRLCKYASAWSDVANNVMYLPYWAQTDMTLLHELGHFCEPKPLDHGDSFIACDLALVTRFMGPEAGKCFKHSLIAYGLL